VLAKATAGGFGKSDKKKLTYEGGMVVPKEGKRVESLIVRSWVTNSKAVAAAGAEPQLMEPLQAFQKVSSGTWWNAKNKSNILFEAST